VAASRPPMRRPATAAPGAEGPDVPAPRRATVAAAVLLAVAALAALLAFAATRSGDASPDPLALGLAIGREGGIAGLVLLAAFGLGGPLRRLLLPVHPDGGWIQAPLGVALLLVLAALLGRLGLLGRPAVVPGAGTGAVGGGAALLVLLGLALAAPGVLRGLRRLPAVLRRPAGPTTWAGLAVLPALAVLLAASASAPGWLWASEFGGYDALSYHLQLPVEWSRAEGVGRVVGLEHNVYSFLPSYAESAYLLLLELGGGAIDDGLAAQFLHAGTMLLAAAATGRLAWRLAARWTAPGDDDDGRPSAAPVLVGLLAAGLLLGTPWTIVAGSLAYNEGFCLLLLAGGLLVILGPERGLGAAPGRGGIALGMLAGAACGAKLTAAGFVALPLLVAAGLRTRRRGDAALVLVGLDATALACLLPWLVSNALVAGNPVFPFLAGPLGAAHWSDAQVAAWNAAHLSGASGAGGGHVAVLVEAWRQLPAYGIGAPPPSGEPWAPQWSILPWLALAGTTLLLAAPRRRGAVIPLVGTIVVQAAFWLAFTHVKSRFMLSAAPTLAVLAALAVLPRLESRPPGRTPAAAAGIGAILLAWCLLPAWIWWHERGGAPAAAIAATDLLDGDAWPAVLERGDLPAAERAVLLDAAPPAYWTRLGLGPGVGVLMAGEAAPWHHRGARFEYATVWDRGRLSDWMALHRDDPAAARRSATSGEITHVLLDEAMLANWHTRGWGDPTLEPAAVRAFLASVATEIRRFPARGQSLWRIDRPAAPTG